MRERRRGGAFLMALKRALIVDDSRSMRQMVSFTLKEAGFEVLEAENGAIRN